MIFRRDLGCQLLVAEGTISEKVMPLGKRLPFDWVRNDPWLSKGQSISTRTKRGIAQRTRGAGILARNVGPGMPRVGRGRVGAFRG